MSIYENFEKEDESFSKLYDIITSLENDKKAEIIDDLKKRLEYSHSRLNNFDEKDENIELFTFLSDIVLEIYFKQHLVEYILNKI